MSSQKSGLKYVFLISVIFQKFNFHLWIGTHVIISPLKIFVFVTNTNQRRWIRHFLMHWKVYEQFSEEELLSKPSSYDSINFVKNLPKDKPRLIKTHFSYEMLPKQTKTKKTKIIYVTRNPRDAVVSYYSHWKLFEGHIMLFVRANFESC